MNKIALFDMDGTLTPAREPIDASVMEALQRLHTAGYEIGIVTGSDLEYIHEQLQDLISSELGDYIHWLPCNGVKYYYGSDPKPLYSDDMIAELGGDRYFELLKFCMLEQARLMSNPDLAFPLTGSFFQYRGTMLNWCPIGRDAIAEERAKWKEIDTHNKIRIPIIQKFKRKADRLGLEGIEMKLGGNTSFDIYPTGWDKTYALRHFEGYEIYFVGDSCHPAGNDYTIFKACQPRSWQVSGPKDTIKVIDTAIISGD